MGTKTKTYHDTNAEGKARTEVEVKAKFKVIVDTWDSSNRKFTWQAIDESIKALKEHGWLRRRDITKYWGDILDPTSISRSNYASQISYVAEFFANSKVEIMDNKLYKKWKDKCGIRTIYNEISGEEKKLADRMDRKNAKANTNKESVDEEAEALENVGNKEAAAAVRNKAAAAKSSTNKKGKEETGGWTASIPNANRRWRKETQEIIEGEPTLFYKTIIGFAEMKVLTEGWGDLANRDMAKLR